MDEPLFIIWTMTHSIVSNMKFILIVFLFLFVKFGVSQMDSDSIFIDAGDFKYRKRPITNREYIVYLLWNLEVYGPMFPHRIKEILPPNALKTASGELEDPYQFFKHLNKSSLLSNYILNPKYIDYPLIGLSKAQMTLLLKWMSDRYNEVVLANKGYVDLISMQLGPECFTMESYLVGQYQGVKTIQSFEEWKALRCKPMFIMPNEKQLNTILTNSNQKDAFRAYTFGKRDFLWQFSEKYIQKVDDHSIELNLFEAVVLKTSNDSSFDDENISYTYHINEVLVENQPLEVFEFNKYDHYPEKNVFGQMDFSIIGYQDSMLLKVLKNNHSDVSKDFNKICFLTHYQEIK